MMDQIYTPEAFARMVVEACGMVRVRSIADFAAGDGALLKAGRARWPGASLFGSDVDEGAVAALSSGLATCKTAVCDFLAEDDHIGWDGVTALAGSFDLILLNPPFTCKGNARYTAQLGKAEYRGSKALVFVARATRFLANQGEILAIVPASCVRSDKDADLFAALQREFIVEQVGGVIRAAFQGHAVSVVVLRVRNARPRLRNGAGRKPSLVPLRAFSVRIMRGTQPVHRVQASLSGVPMIHTSEIRAGAVLPPRFFVEEPTRIVSGEAVLISRVGRPSVEKIAVKSAPDAVLSDCVIALQTQPEGNERELASLLRTHWDQFSMMYGGSCAPYTTVSRVQAELLSIGVASVAVQDMRAQPRPVHLKQAKAVGAR